MKKFLSLLLLFGSLSAFAGSPTCRVYGSKNNAVATLDRTNVTSNGSGSYGSAKIMGNVSLTTTESENTTIIVEAWDGNQLIGTKTVTITANNHRTSFTMDSDNGIEKGKTYRLAISSATCE